MLGAFLGMLGGFGQGFRSHFQAQRKMRGSFSFGSVRARHKGVCKQ